MNRNRNRGRSRRRGRSRSRSRGGPSPTVAQRRFRQFNTDALQTLLQANGGVLSKVQPMRVHSFEIDSILLGALWVEDERRLAGVEHGQESDAVHFRERDRGQHV